MSEKTAALKPKAGGKTVMEFITKWGTMLTILLLFLVFTFGNWNS